MGYMTIDYKKLFSDGDINRITNNKIGQTIERYGNEYYLYCWVANTFNKIPHITKSEITKRKCKKILKRWSNEDCDKNLLGGIYFSSLLK